MTRERIKEIATRLREFAEFAQGEYVSTSVNLEIDDYYVDLGAFGEQSMTVNVEEDYYQFDADNLLDNYPINSGTFIEFADELDEYEPETKDATLDTVLARMEKDGQGALVRALRAVAEAFQSIVLKASDMNGLSIGPLPATPLPWPGALRPEIDYTADDFPLRYQPPPGYDWATVAQRYSYQNAVRATASSIAGGGTMVLDKVGRVRWYNGQDKDDYSSGERWRVWHMNRDSIPAANGFKASDPPHAVDRDGASILEDGQNDPFSFPEAVKQRVRELREEYEKSIVPKNEYGVTYDPLTCELEDTAVNTFTKDLRVGNFVNSYGRVLRVKEIRTDEFLVEFDGSAGDREDVRYNFDWSGKRIVGWENQPTALSLSEPYKRPAVEYDPLTVIVSDESSTVRSDELRLGDDLVGRNFGRVTGIEDGFIVMNRDGQVNKTEYGRDGFLWSVKTIIVGDTPRESIPTAISQQAVPA